ncbi:hypothetical protein FBBAL38_00650 [Flavobacteria bacterium BAL38]|nr:hypothetical protein FBBAL38_00650 [Flavobacteria bacterium BAL38]
MKKIIFFILFINFCYSQEKELTINEIDSIVKTSKNIIQSSGIIKKNKKTIGGFNLTEISFNNKLIYSSYGENTTDKKINFNDFYEFYFFNENPIFVRINIEKTNIKDNSKEVFKAELNETESTSLKEIKNPFLINLRMKLNRIIFDFINNMTE